MPDGLTDEERVLAWKASWNPSFVGTAIVNTDFTFRSVNDQWCEFFGVTAAEFIGKSFSDITPQPIRALDEANAKLLMEGKAISYMLPKCYELSDGRRQDFLLLVVGVYHQESKDFLFFVSRIMSMQEDSESASQSRKQISSLFAKIKDYWPVIAALLGAVALLGAELIKRLN